MTIYYDPLVFFPRVLWSKTIYPRVLVSLEFWICAVAHIVLTVLLRLDYIQPNGGSSGGSLVPWELALALMGLCGLSLTQLLQDCKRWHEALTAACARVGEQTLRFAQELQATFGLVEEVVPVRFAAGKYALAAVYVFFFSLTSGSVAARGWSELRAKGLLDDQEVHFLGSQYAGDRLALLHVWAMWAAQEAASTPSARAQLGPEAIAGGLTRLSEALRGASDAAREAAGRAAVPVPYHQFQLHDTLALVTLLMLAALAAPFTAAGEYAASALYLAILIATVGLREATASLLDPLRKDGLGQGFPVSTTVNTTADAVAQLLIGAAPAAFNPRPGWWDPDVALLSQNQIERRTPAAAFGTEGANPCHWPPVKASVAGDQPSPPLLDSGCCHLDVEALSCSAKHWGDPLQVARRPRQEGLGALLARVQHAAEGGKAFAKGGNVSPMGAPPSTSTTEPSEASTSSARGATGTLSAAGDNASEAETNDWEAVATGFAMLPREHSLASSVAGFCYPGAIGATKASRGVLPRRSFATDPVVVTGTWATPKGQPPCPRGGPSVSPDDLILTTSSPTGATPTPKEASRILPPLRPWGP